LAKKELRTAATPVSWVRIQCICLGATFCIRYLAIQMIKSFLTHFTFCWNWDTQ